MPDAITALGIIAEQRIREAIDAGDLDNLPGMGKPLELEDLSNVPEELRMAYKILKNANCLPPEIADRKELARLADMLENCPDEKESLRKIKKMRFLLDRLRSGRQRHMALEENDGYYQKILSRIEVFESKTHLPK